jgi:outer membrane protein assembly factor BamD
LLIDALRNKLEMKGWNSAYQYYHMRNYQAASVSFKTFMREWPNSKHREDALWLTLRSDHAMALNSVESKKRERVIEAIRSFRNFADAFPQSGLMPDAEKMHQELNAILEKTSTPQGQ